MFKQQLFSIVEKHAPMKEKLICGKDCPWLTKAIRRDMKERDYYLTKARNQNNKEDWALYRRYRNRVTASIRHKKANYNKNLLHEHSNEPKKFWTTIKKYYPTKSKNNTNLTFIVNGEKLEHQSIANGFCTFFTNIGSELQKSVIALQNRIWTDYNKVNTALGKNINYKDVRFKFKPVELRDVLKDLNSLKPGKASGYDKLPIKIVKDCSDVLAFPLTELINKSLETSTFPNIEKIAKVTPIFKNGTKSSFDNYRPISILPVFSKLLEGTVHRQLYSYLEENNFLTDRQFGFRKSRNTSQAITYITDFIRSAIDRGEYTGAIYVDLKKAFDTINHATILSKLSVYGINDTELSWFIDYLFNRKHFVEFNTTRSKYQDITSGVPQGSILGPLLLLLLMNDIEHVITSCEVLLYADDMVIFFASKNVSLIESTLTKDLQQISDWLIKNQLIINLKAGKTEAVLFGTTQKLKKFKELDIKLNTVKINNVTSYDYLGIIMDNTLSFKDDIQRTQKKAVSRTNLFFRIRSNLTPHAAKTVYNTMIRPLFTYSNLINLASKTYFKNFQRIQNRSFKIISGKVKLSNWKSIESFSKKKASHLVFKCLNKMAPEILCSKFEKIKHGISTRSNGMML